MISDAYNKNGYVLIKGFFSEKELQKLDKLLGKFHEHWLLDYAEFYNTQAINSAYLTDKKYLDRQERFELFEFISREKTIDVLTEIIPLNPCFMNTQLFFDPKNKEQNNYWHRDIQYLDISEEAQQTLLFKQNTNVLHFRIPLKKENGIELIPGTHKRWDTEIEYAVRNELGDKKCFDELPASKKIALDRTDLLVFSAKMIHRGLYGMERFSLDILYCDNTAELFNYTKRECYPDSEEIKKMQHGYIFQNALNTINLTQQL